MGMQFASVLCLSVAATGTVAAHRFVTPAGAQAGADANTFGVTRSSAISGEIMPVDVLGTAVVESGAAFSVGATLKCDASGRAITWATSGARVALAMEAAGAAGRFVEVLLVPNVA